MEGLQTKPAPTPPRAERAGQKRSCPLVPQICPQRSLVLIQRIIQKITGRTFLRRIAFLPKCHLARQLKTAAVTHPYVRPAFQSLTFLVTQTPGAMRFRPPVPPSSRKPPLRPLQPEGLWCRSLFSKVCLLSYSQFRVLFS